MMMVVRMRPRQRSAGRTTAAAAATTTRKNADAKGGALMLLVLVGTRSASTFLLLSSKALLQLPLILLLLLLLSCAPGAQLHQDGVGGHPHRLLVASAAAFTAATATTTSSSSTLVWPERRPSTKGMVRRRRRRRSDPAFLFFRSSETQQQQQPQQRCGGRRTTAILLSLKDAGQSPAVAGAAAAQQHHPQQCDAAAGVDDDEEAAAAIKQAIQTLRECQSPAEIRDFYYDAVSNKNTEKKKNNPTLAIAAAALRRLTQLVVLQGKEESDPHHHHGTAFVGAREDDAGALLPILLRPIHRHAVQQQQQQRDAIPTRRTVDAIVDAAVSLDLWQRQQRQRRTSAGLEGEEYIRPLQTLLRQTLHNWERQQLPDDGGSGKTSRSSSSRSITQTLSPSRLVHCLRAMMSSDELDDDDESLSSSSLLVQNLCTRLRQGGILARLSPFDLVTLLSTSAAATTVVASSSSSSSNDDDSSDGSRLLLIKAVARRLRKKQVRAPAPTVSLIYALDAARRLWLKLPHEQERNDDNDDSVGKEQGTAEPTTTAILRDVRHELQIMTYSLTRQVIVNVNNNNNNNNEPSQSIEKEDENTSFPSSMDSLWTPSHAATVCHAAQEVLCVTADDTVVQSLCETLQNSTWTMGTVHTHDLARILEALLKWQQQDDFPELIETLGQHFATNVQECTGHANGSSHPPRPRDVNVILRSVAFLGAPCVPEPYLTAATQLFLDPIFLKKCTALELSNFAWFAAFKTDGYWHEDDKVRNALAYRILDSDVLESCSPMMACRILNAFTELYCSSSQTSSSAGGELPMTNEQPQHSILLSSLFSSLGEQLLSTQLSPLDFTSAIYAYSKSSHVFDIGIFDHLVELMASRVSECTLRQVSQSLWACGKMAQWDSVNDEDNVATFVEPPYLKSASHLATYLSYHADELCPKDVAQALWALARLQLHGADLVEPLVERAKAIADEMNSQEVANTLWALGRLETSNSKAIFTLTRRFSQPMETKAVKPQEASNILHALAKMDVRDDAVFRNLTKQMLDQIDATSAQAVANALWAHRAVHIEPPQTLLNTWASQKLGLVAVAQRDPDYLY